LIREFDLAISSYRLGENKSLLSSSYGREKPPSSFACELSFDLEATDAPALLPRKLARRYPPFFDEIPSFTIDIRGDVASSFARGGKERPVLAFNRDMPVGFLYIDGELAESMGNADEFLCSLISGYDGLESWFAPSVFPAETLKRPLLEPLYSESCNEGKLPALMLADSRAAYSSASGGFLYCPDGFSSSLSKSETKPSSS